MNLFLKPQRTRCLGGTSLCPGRETPALLASPPYLTQQTAYLHLGLP